MIADKRIYASLLFLFLGVTTFAQLNISYVGQYNYNESLNDSWGYTDANGNEYALIGARNGVSVLDLSTPSSPVEIGYAPGASSTWRDIKVWGNYAYVTCDQGQDGLMIIDLSNAPTGITYSFWRPELTLPNGTDTLNTAHNIWIDENGVAYLSGPNISNRGVIMLDVATTPGTPIYLGAEDFQYAHDCYARGDTLYTADIYGGYFSIYDVSNKANPIFLGSQTTPTLFTHNLWLSDNSNVLFTTDEKPDAYVGAYDVSDPSNIVELDRYRPDSTLGMGVIPHNVHVWDDYLIISYYTDGCILVDASRPHNLIEVGNFDTYIPPTTGFQGVWGAYPYFASGLIVASDIGNGAYILQPNYVRACYLEGQVTDASNGNPINGVDIEILGTLRNETTDFNGDYATGYAVSGTYQVRFSAPGYQSKTETAILNNGVLTILDVQLQPFISFVLTGVVNELGTGNQIDGATVRIYNDTFEYVINTDQIGNFSVNGFYPGDYDIVAGKWGYKMSVSEDQTIPLNSSGLTIYLDKGYEDNFALDLGWTTATTATTGEWVRVDPIGTTTNQGVLVNPEDDITTDYGVECYVTGNGGGGIGDDDIDGGDVTLVSPDFDVSTMNDPYISYYAWFYNAGGSGGPNDDLVITLHDGIQSYTVQTITQSFSQWRPRKVVRIKDYIPNPPANLHVEFKASDNAPGHLVEAAIDMFTVFDSTGVNTNNLEQGENTVLVAPNPSATDFTLVYNLQNSYQNARFRVYNAIGQFVEEIDITHPNGFVVFGENLSSGVYVVQLIVDGQRMNTIRAVKQE